MERVNANDLEYRKGQSGPKYLLNGYGAFSGRPITLAKMSPGRRTCWS